MAARTAATKTEKVIEIPQIQLARTVVGIVGTTPLLTNRFSERARQSIEDKQGHAPKGPREARDPDAEFHDAMHLIADGVYGFPANGLKKALVAAGGRFADEKMTMLRGVVNIAVSHVPIEGPAPTMRTDPVRLNGGKFSLAYRPQFFPWAMHVPIVFNSAIISEGQILNLFQIAGFSVGIGAWRPESNGVFGQFTLEDAGAMSSAA